MSVTDINTIRMVTDKSQKDLERKAIKRANAAILSSANDGNSFVKLFFMKPYEADAVKDIYEKNGHTVSIAFVYYRVGKQY